ncbi:uncharacterized protein METZ01_LOCUS118567, partial [marine metagenome]
LSAVGPVPGGSGPSRSDPALHQPVSGDRPGTL